MSIDSPTLKRIIVSELDTEPLKQTTTVSKQMILERIMLHLFVSGNPTGTVVCRVKGGATILSECVLELSEAMQRANKTKSYYQGFVSFQFPKPPILKPDIYTVELASGTYSFGSNWVGWVKIPSQGMQLNSFAYPHSFQVVEIRTI